MISTPFGRLSLFNLKSSRQSLLALFLKTAFPKRLPTPIPILENDRSFGATTNVNSGNLYLFPLMKTLLKSWLLEILSALESENLFFFNPLPSISDA